ncbi:plasma membrane H+-transporting ATPase [Rhizoctonia solani]|uniref:Plasma membrane H+-transporting ATPase n=1 Tax=Rhizoctonia solani TaxID=456999 RepID=A0A0K6G7C6_9AGAM|nr:plasma membrane H+-transporting ATPase [Rhizoctonia solani]
MSVPIDNPLTFAEIKHLAPAHSGREPTRGYLKPNLTRTLWQPMNLVPRIRMRSISTWLTPLGIKLFNFEPFNLVDKRTEVTCCEESPDELKRVTKGMTIPLSNSSNKAEQVEKQLEADVTEFHDRSLRALATVAMVKMVTGDQLAIAKETGRLGLGDHMYPVKVLKDGPPPGGKHMSLDEMIMDADGFAGVFPENKYEIVKRLRSLGHLCAMTGDSANDVPAYNRTEVWHGRARKAIGYA